MEIQQLWWLSLGIAAVVIVVVAVLLGLIIATAKKIETRANAIWMEGKQIAGNTVALWMLEKTTNSLREMKESVKAIKQHAGGR